MPERDIGNRKSGEKAQGGGGSSSRGKQWLFGIGISKYFEYTNLANAVKDVNDIIKVLTEDYGVSPSDTITLFDEEATRENIIHELDQLANKVGHEDNLLIYFAGHGYMNPTTDIGYWIPHDAKKGKTSIFIGNSTLIDYLRAINSRHTLLIADSCFSGSFFKHRRGTSEALAHELELKPSRWAICSGRHDEEVDDGVPGQNSPFAKSILDALRGNTDQLLRVTKVIDHVLEQTHFNSGQVPEGKPINDVGDDGGQYIFHRKAREEKCWEECIRKNSISGYHRYLEQFDEGKHRTEALFRIKELEDEAAWKSAEKSNTISAFYAYIDRDPDGKYIEEAKEQNALLVKQQVEKETRLKEEARLKEEEIKRRDAAKSRADEAQGKAKKERLKAEAKKAKQPPEQQQGKLHSYEQVISVWKETSKGGVIGVLFALLVSIWSVVWMTSKWHEETDTPSATVASEQRKPDTVKHDENQNESETLNQIQSEIRSSHYGNSIGRGGYKPEAIVIHTAEGSLSGSMGYFYIPREESASIHYIVSRKGQIISVVKEEDAAWHAGRKSSNAPSSFIQERPRVNPNKYTIGIEGEGYGKDDWTPEMYQATARLIAEISIRWNIEIDHDHVLGHNEIYTVKTCPGVVNLKLLIKEANKIKTNYLTVQEIKD